MFLARLHEQVLFIWQKHLPRESEEQSSAALIFQECLDTFRHDRVRAHHVVNEHEETACLMAVLHIVFHVNFLVKVLADDERHHRLDTACADEVLGHTVAAHGHGKARSTGSEYSSQKEC